MIQLFRYKLWQGGFRLDIRKILSQVDKIWKGFKALEQTGGVSVPGSVQKTAEYGPWAHGLMVNMVVLLCWWLDLMILKVFSNLEASMILLWSTEITLMAFRKEMDILGVYHVLFALTSVVKCQKRLWVNSLWLWNWHIRVSLLDLSIWKYSKIVVRLKWYKSLHNKVSTPKK